MKKAMERRKMTKRKNEGEKKRTRGMQVNRQARTKRRKRDEKEEKERRGRREVGVEDKDTTRTRGKKEGKEKDDEKKKQDIKERTKERGEKKNEERDSARSRRGYWILGFHFLAYWTEVEATATRRDDAAAKSVAPTCHLVVLDWTCSSDSVAWNSEVCERARVVSVLCLSAWFLCKSAWDMEEIEKDQGSITRASTA